ncbi:MAG: hypothetical protein IJR90_05165, partial [Clostridia bacterium]|nr:hypothetical protein [Clostridia bacterium]
MKRSALLRILLCVVLVAVCVIVIASCDKKPVDPVDTTDPDKPVEKHYDDLPNDLDFNKEQVNIFYWGHTFVINELTADGSTGDVVDLAIDARNVKVEERLNVKLNPIQGEAPAEVFMPVVRDEILSGSTDYDIILGPQCTSTEVAAAGAFRDLAGEKYLDFSKPYWSEDYIQALSVNKKRFLIGGDISLTTTAWTSTMLFYIEPFENIFGSPDDFYELILSGDGDTGGWTLDVMSDYCKKCYINLNGNAVRDTGDQFGLGMGAGSSNIDRFIYSSGMSISKRDENNVPYLDIKNSKLIDYFNKFYEFFHNNEGVNFTKDNSAPANTAGQVDDVFNACGMNEIVELRAEEKDFGVIPFPKVDSEMTSYKSWLSDNTVICGIPITEPDDRMPLATSVIECIASENYELTLPAYYETALKDKYTRDDYSSKMLDIIHDGETNDFAVTYAMSINGIGYMFRDLIGNAEPNIMSWYEAKESKTLAKLQELYEAFDQQPDIPTVTTTPVDTKDQPSSGSDTEDPNAGFADNQISTSWKVFGSKYKKSQILVRPDMSDEFRYIINDDDEIEVDSPVSGKGGYNPTAVIQSRSTVPIVGLSTEFHTNEPFSYSITEGYCSSVSFVWIDKELVEIPHYLEAMGTNGVRDMVPEDASGFAVCFMGTQAEGNGGVADYLYIILFDGKNTNPEPDGHHGTRWSNKILTDTYSPIS